MTPGLLSRLALTHLQLNVQLALSADRLTIRAVGLNSHIGGRYIEATNILAASHNDRDVLGAYPRHEKRRARSPGRTIHHSGNFPVYLDRHLKWASGCTAKHNVHSIIAADLSAECRSTKHIAPANCQGEDEQNGRSQSCREHPVSRAHGIQTCGYGGQYSRNVATAARALIAYRRGGNPSRLERSYPVLGRRTRHPAYRHRDGYRRLRGIAPRRPHWHCAA